MEAVFIRTELRSPGAREVLLRIANDPAFCRRRNPPSYRVGTGNAGLKSYGDLVPFIRDPERDVVLHAIAAFGQDTPLPVVLQLIDELISGDDRRAPAASEALRIIGGGLVLKNLIEAARTRKDFD